MNEEDKGVEKLKIYFIVLIKSYKERRKEQNVLK